MNHTTPAFAQALRQTALLTPEQAAELPALEARCPGPGDLAGELQRRGWLTAYQVEHLLRGDGEALKLGSYLLIDRIGEGGMGTVFKARQRSLDRVVALKVIRQDRLAHPSAVQRFQREVRAAAQLSHPNVVLSYDADQVGASHFLVMEYVEGIDLGQVVRRRGPLPVAEACEYVRQAALGLQHAFERGMVHRDLKPSNLLLGARRGAAAVVKVLDFGLARLDEVSDGDGSNPTLTHEGLVIGTLDFMAPEQGRDAHRADIRADIYSLGCTLFYLLTGRVPFGGHSVAEKMHGHLFAEPPSPVTFRADVPAEVSLVVRRAMAKSPDDRFQSPAELAASLTVLVQSITTAALASPPRADTSDSLTGTASPWSRLAETSPGSQPTVPAPRPSLRRALWLSGSAVALGLLILVVLAPWNSPPDEPQPTPPTDSGKGKDDAPPPPPPPREPPSASAPFGEQQANDHRNRWTRYLGQRIDVKNDLGMRFFLIPPGDYDRGITEQELATIPAELTDWEEQAQLRATPKHRVFITRPFYLGAREVTVREFQAFVDATGYRTRAERFDTGSKAWDDVQAKWLDHKHRNWRNPGWDQTPDHPVTCLCWYDAVAFCGWLTRKEGHVYRLPTEAEWEYACRAGTTTLFHFGSGRARQYAVLGLGGRGKTEKTGTHPPNRFGLADMHGNVMEWCGDWFEPYRAGQQADPSGPLLGTERVLRGGPYDAQPRNCRSDFRLTRPPSHRSTSMGFRVLREIPPKEGRPPETFTPLFNGKDLDGWDTVYNPDQIAERYTVVNEDGEPALRSPGTGRLKIARRGEWEYHHLRLEVKFPTNATRRYLTINHSRGSSGLFLQLENLPASLSVKLWGGVLFDQATLRKGTVEVANRGLNSLVLSADALKPPGEWNRVELFSVGEVLLWRVNGHTVAVLANLRLSETEPIVRGHFSLGAGSGEMFFRRVEVRPLQYLPPDLPDGP